MPPTLHTFSSIDRALTIGAVYDENACTIRYDMPDNHSVVLTFISEVVLEFCEFVRSAEASRHAH